MNKVLQWIIINTVFIFCAIYGLFYHVGWAENIFLFIAWVTIIVSFIISISSETYENEVPLIAEQIFDMIIVLIMAASGRFIIAFFYLIQISLYTFEKRKV